VTWMLQKILDDNKITAYELAKHAPREKERVIYNFARQESPTQIHISTLETLIAALAEKGVNVEPNDLFKVEA